MNTDSKKPLTSPVMLEILHQGVTVDWLALTAAHEVTDILAYLADHIGDPFRSYRLWYVIGPDRTPTQHAALGQQQDLEHKPLIELILFVDATLLTLDQRYRAHIENNPV